MAAATMACAEELKFNITPNFFVAQPDNQAIGACHGGVVTDKAGNIYVTTDTKRGILVFAPDGKFLRNFGPTQIHGLELIEEGGVEYIIAARPNFNQVVKLKLPEGEREWTIRAPKEADIYKNAEGKFVGGGFRPCAATIAPDGSIFVADGYGSHYVLKFAPDPASEDKSPKFVKAFGGPGAAEGKFNTCHGIGMDTRSGKPLLLVCDRNNNRVQHWDIEGNFVSTIQKGLRMPAAVHIRGDYAVFPELQGRVTILGKDGSIVAQLGDNPNAGQRANFGLPADQWKDGICNSPHGACLDKDGNVIVAEWSQFGHLHKFSRQK